MGRQAFKKKISTKVKNPKRVEERHGQIFQAALKLIKKKGYHMTTLRDISKETGIGLGNLYDYIGGKEDILYLVHEKATEMVHQEVNGKGSDVKDPVQKLEQIIEMELDAMNKYQDLIILLYQESHALNKPSLRSILSSEEAHIGRFKEVLDKGIQSGVFKPCNTTMMANVIKMMIDSWVLKRWALRGKVSLKEMKRGIVEMVLNGIMTNENKQNQ